MKNLLQKIAGGGSRAVASNSIKIVIAKLGSKLGDLLANTKTVLPWILTAAGAPAFFAAALAPIRESGSLIPQMLIGQYIARYAIKKWFFVIGSMIQGLSILAIAVSSLLFEGKVLGIFSLVFIAIFSLARALCSLSSKDVIGKTIPVARRGRLGGISASASGAMSIIAGVIIAGNILQEYGIDNNASGLSYILFGAAFFWFLSALSFAFIREQQGESEQQDKQEEEKSTNQDGSKEKRNHPSLAALFQEYKHLLGEKSYRRFLLVRTLMISSSLALPYYIILAQQNDKASNWTLGLFIVLTGIANLTSGWFWGRLSDQSSRRVMIISAWMTSALLTLSVCLIAIDFNKENWLFAGLYFILSIIHAGVRSGRKTYILDLSDDDNRIHYVSFANTSIGVTLLFAGLAIAFISSYSILAVLCVFAVSAACAGFFGKYLPEVEPQE